MLVADVARAHPKVSYMLTETNVPGRKIIVIAAKVFMAAESRLLATAIVWEIRAILVPAPSSAHFDVP